MDYFRSRIFLKKLYGPFLWMGLNCLKATATSRMQFCILKSTIKGAKRHMKLKLMVFPEWYLVGINRPFWTQNYSLLSKLHMHSQDFLRFCTVKGAKRHMKFILVIFAKKIFVEGEWVIVGLKMLCPQNSWSALKDLFCSFVEWKGWKSTWKWNDGFLVFCKYQMVYILLCLLYLLPLLISSINMQYSNYCCLFPVSWAFFCTCSWHLSLSLFCQKW